MITDIMRFIIRQATLIELCMKIDIIEITQIYHTVRLGAMWNDFKILATFKLQTVAMNEYPAYAGALQMHTTLKNKSMSLNSQLVQGWTQGICAPNIERIHAVHADMLHWKSTTQMEG